MLIMAAVAGALAGWAVRRWVERGTWRLPGEQKPMVLPPWWAPIAVAGMWPLLLARLDAVDHRAAWPAVAVLAVVAVALTDIDVVVHRLPDPLTLGSLPAVGLLLVMASAVEGDWSGWLTAAWAVGVGAPVLLILGLGGLGLGDVKLGVLLSMALGWFGIGPAFLGIMLGFVLGGLWAAVLMVSRRATRATRFAYGPWMMLGAFAALVITPT
ncbi:prepilin peptidase [Demetria terragena]|uniref:prepilin peptidase n=1 Tax=Demetria terragena TaxID=63959 RepID=UPI00037ECCFE|nr:prepilin peptidase [Demetria terragena]